MPTKTTTPLLWDFLPLSSGWFVSVFHFLPFFQRCPFVLINLFIFVGFVQLDDSLFVGIEIVLSSSLSLFSTFTVTVFDANQCLGSLINHGFVLYFAHLGFVEIVLLLDIAYYTYDSLVIQVWFYYMYDFLFFVQVIFWRKNSYH